MPERDANQLAADVREALLRLSPNALHMNTEDVSLFNATLRKLDELVGLVGTLQQERDDIRARLLVAYENEGVGEVFAYAAGCVERECERREAAEAALAEAVKERDDADRAAGRHIRALATTRQALADIERDIDAAWTKALDNADADDADGAHVGLARHARARAEGLAHAHSIVTIARRALADTGGDTA